MNWCRKKSWILLPTGSHNRAFFQIIFGAMILFSKHFWGHHLLSKHSSYFSIFLWACIIKIANFRFSISYKKKIGDKLKTAEYLKILKNETQDFKSTPCRKAQINAKNIPWLLYVSSCQICWCLSTVIKIKLFAKPNFPKNGWIWLNCVSRERLIVQTPFIAYLNRHMHFPVSVSNKLYV